MSDPLDDVFARTEASLTISQVADILGVSRQAVTKWIQEGTIPAYKLGPNTRWLIFRDELKAALAAGRNTYRDASGEGQRQVVNHPEPQA